MSPRKSDLQEFWSLLSQRSSMVPVDSLDLGVYIYQERRFSNWINPYLPADESNVRALSAAQRYAAALLLYYDDFHFKRRLSDVSKDPGHATLTNKEDSIFVIEGGYRCLDEGMALYREGEVFRSIMMRVLPSDSRKASPREKLHSALDALPDSYVRSRCTAWPQPNSVLHPMLSTFSRN